MGTIGFLAHWSGLDTLCQDLAISRNRSVSVLDALCYLFTPPNRHIPKVNFSFFHIQKMPFTSGKTSSHQKPIFF